MMNPFVVLKDAWVNRDKLGDGSKQQDLSAFLPAALEIQETPPNPIARWLAWSVVVLISLGCVWAYYGQINIVATAEGKIVPSSRVKQVQPLEKGFVKKILVSEGQYVEKGEALIELDQTMSEADNIRLQSELNSTQMRLTVNESLLQLIEKSKQKKFTLSQQELELSSADLILESEAVLARRLLWQSWLEFLSQKQTLKSTLQKTLAEQAGSKEVLTKLWQTLPIIEKRTETLKGLLENNYVSELDYLQAEAERIQVVQDLAAEQQRFKQLEAAEQEVREQLNTQQAQAASKLLSEIADLNQRMLSLAQELTKTKDRTAKQVLYAPVSGRVQELAVTTEGGVVTDAQQLMIIVPDENQLEATVFLENKDIGFVEEGMPAEIKIHTFPFTKYGVIDAQVVNVSDDATVDEQRGLIYGMQLKMDKNTIIVNGKQVKLMPGMAITAEVQTGYRRVIEFFLSPLLRKGKEGLRER